jgi:hypothetical protein
MKRPLHSFFNMGSNQTKAPTFGQKRAEQLDTRLNKAIIDRRKIARAEYAADAPLDETYQQKGSLLGNKIDRLQKEIADTKE